MSNNLATSITLPAKIRAPESHDIPVEAQQRAIAQMIANWRMEQFAVEVQMRTEQIVNDLLAKKMPKKKGEADDGAPHPRQYVMDNLRAELSRCTVSIATQEAMLADLASQAKADAQDEASSQAAADPEQEVA